MNQRQIGILVLIIGIIFAIFMFGMKEQADEKVDIILNETGACFTPEGACLHQENNKIYLFGGIPAVALIILGLYLTFFDKTYQLFLQQQESLNNELVAAKQKDEFKAYLAGFTPEEQSILKAVREQEGIKQNTLRLRVGMSKAMLSILLNSLEKRDILTKKKSGKTNEVYLRKKFWKNYMYNSKNNQNYSRSLAILIYINPFIFSHDFHYKFVISILMGTEGIEPPAGGITFLKTGAA